MEPSELPDIDDSIMRYAHDMARARVRSGLSIDDIHRSTKIAQGILEEFEQTGLADNPLYNRVYLRSFISTYARTVGIDCNQALSALESALNGAYDDSILSDGSDDALDEETEEAHTRETPTGEIGEGVDTRDRPEDAAPAPPDAHPDRKSDRAAVPQPEHVPADQLDAAGADANRTRPNPEADSAATTEPVPEDQPNRAINPPSDPSASSEVTRRFRFEPIRPEIPRAAHGGHQSAGAKVKAEISTAIHDYREPTPQKGLIIPPNRVKTTLSIILVVVITVSAGFLALKLSSNGPASSTSSPATIQQAGQLPSHQQLQEPVRPVVPEIILGDSIRVTVVAADGPLDPIRVKLDRDLRRPYWIDEGDSMVFVMSSEITLEELLDRATVKLEGIPYAPYDYRTQRRLVITRDSVLRFVENLRSS